MSMTHNSFDTYFEYLTGYAPFPWQKKLYGEFLEGQFRSVCSIPTGLGKTSIISIWLLALAHRVDHGSLNDFPRRLVYVVNRRTVVDQATDEARKTREALLTKPELSQIASALQSLQTQIGDIPLAISTLRGQFADNAEWRDDPASPAVIVGTVDMIGSRLLFSGYGCGFKSKPLHAGFLGQDTLLVHDEAHLEPAFQKLVTAIASEQQRCREFNRFQVMELTATSRTEVSDINLLLTDEDRAHEVVRKRIEAKKGIAFHPVADDKNVAAMVEQLALEHKESGQAILIFLQKLDDVKKVVEVLHKNGLVVETLTGILRGLERDALAKENGIFARFMRGSLAEAQSGTVYLVCTSAGEVGVNISADHLVCDLTPFDSMTQRFGRVNRFGDGDARIDIAHRKLDLVAAEEQGASLTADISDEEMTLSTEPEAKTEQPESSKKSKPVTPYDRACAQTFLLLQRLPKAMEERHDASPAALAELPGADRQAAFTPQPVILSVSDILFDTWALTTIREKLPGRPPVAEWLHGVEDWEPPVTWVAWREEVRYLSSESEQKVTPEDLLEDYPLKPHELLRDQYKRVRGELEHLAKRSGEMLVWLIDSAGNVEVLTLEKLVEKDRFKNPLHNFDDCIILLPPGAGGLEGGMLNGHAGYRAGVMYDIADQWLDEKNKARRCRIWDNQKPPVGMRLVRTLDISPDVEDQQEEGEEVSQRRFWHWYVRPRSADDDGSKSARMQQELSSHLQSAEQFAGKLVEKLGLNTSEAQAVVFAARCHDLGKDRLIWQRSIGNRDYPQQRLAKSGPGMRPVDLSKYRHEFGSLLDVATCPEFHVLDADVQDLVLHLIAAHHGRARPHFPVHEAFDPDRPDSAVADAACEVPRRFGRLQRKYGRWGLAYLESLVRAADIMASQVNLEEVEEGEKP